VELGEVLETVGPAATSGGLPLDDAKGSELRHPRGEPCMLDDVDDALDVLVGKGSFLGQPPV
jgi:hypothetical protein